MSNKTAARERIIWVAWLSDKDSMLGPPTMPWPSPTTVESCEADEDVEMDLVASPKLREQSAEVPLKAAFTADRAANGERPAELENGMASGCCDVTCTALERGDRRLEDRLSIFVSCFRERV